jgi:hypothetical protein
MSGIQMALLGAGGGPLAIILSPGGLYNIRLGAGSITSESITGIASGGTGAGYTYAWTYVSGDSYTINSSSSATTTFTTTLAAEQLKTGSYRCTVTDSASNTASATAIIELEATL